MQHGLPRPGDVVAGKYTVERQIGRGGMGAVYEVIHKITGKRLALKCLLPELLDHPETVERFLREAQAAGRIQHRHVVDIFDVGRDDGLLFIVMAYLQGKPLSELLRDETLTLEEALGILVRAMEGVAAAHARGIVHRDLKPDNVLVCVGPSGRYDDPRVVDFGISKVDDDASAPLTRSGVAMGTPYYMSLEQITGQRDLDQRVDVYAMGVILYEAIAGQTPHVAESVGALAIKLMTTPPRHLGALRPDLPVGLADVVMKAISKERGDRYPTMQALIDAVRPYVPQGAGLLVPEGRGLPLRTPRSSGGTGSDATLPAESSGARVRPVGASAGRPAQVVAISGSPPSQPASVPPLRTSDVPVQEAEGKGAWLAIGAILVAATIGLGVWLQRSTVGPATRVGEPAQTPAQTESAAAAPVPNPALSATGAGATSAEDAVANLPTTTPAQDEPVAVEPAAAVHEPNRHAPTSEDRRAKPKRVHDGVAEPKVAAPSPTPVATPAPPSSAPPASPSTPASTAPSSVKGRAGELKPDEF